MTAGDLGTFTGARLNRLFSASSRPVSNLHGFHRGRILTAAIDPLGVFIGDLCRFWLGKRLTGDAGVNVVTSTGRALLRVAAPSQPLEATPGDSFEGFPFSMRPDEASGVLVLDYDLDSNPSPLVRNLRDELVVVDDGLYLGRILYRLRGDHRPVGFFSLEA